MKALHAPGLSIPPPAAARFLPSTCFNKATISWRWWRCQARQERTANSGQGEHIRVSGKKRVDYSNDVSVHRRERVSLDFNRTLSLPVQVDPDRIRAEYRDGLLALFLPRAETDKPRSIEIKWQSAVNDIGRTVMPTRQELQVPQKRALENKEELTIPARVFLPTADIYENNDALNVVLEMPGVDKWQCRY
jgi:HSP20 family molecular chaperone IbpA